MSLFIHFEGFEDLSDEQRVHILNEYPVISCDDVTYICPSPNDNDSDNPTIEIAFNNSSYDDVALYTDMDHAKEFMTEIWESRWDDEFETYFMIFEESGSGTLKPVAAVKDWAKGETGELWDLYGDNFDDWVENFCNDERCLQEELAQGEEQEFKDIFMNESACDMFTKMVTNKYDPSDSDDIKFKEVEGDMFKCISIATQTNCTYQAEENFNVEATVLAKLILDAAIATSEDVNKPSSSTAPSPRF